MPTQLATLAVFLGSVGWGLTWIPLKYITDSGLHSTHLVLLAFGAGALVITPWLIRQYSNWKRYAGIMAAIAVAGGVSNGAFQTAVAHGDVARVMILFYMLPIWSVLGGRLFLGEVIDARRLLAVALCLVGGALILDLFSASWDTITWIDGLALLSGIGLASTNILFRYSGRVMLLSKVAFIFIGCFVLMSVSALVLPVQEPLPDGNVILLALLYGGVGLTLITASTQWGVTFIDAGRASVIIVTELFVAVFSSALILSSPLSAAEMIGGFLVVSAALIEGFRQQAAEVRAS